MVRAVVEWPVIPLSSPSLVRAGGGGRVVWGKAGGVVLSGSGGPREQAPQQPQHPHSARQPKRTDTPTPNPYATWQMPKGGAAPDERELRRLALAVRMYQEGRPHWELPAGERHSRVWEWVWCAAEWALWMLLLLWDLLSRGPPRPERATPRAAPHPTPPPPPHSSHLHEA